MTPTAIIRAATASNTDIKSIVLYIPSQLSAIVAPIIELKDAKNA